jgi:hypothetical protein
LVRWDEKANLPTEFRYTGSKYFENALAFAVQRRSAMKENNMLTAGVDIGDRYSKVCVVDKED